MKIEHKKVINLFIIKKNKRFTNKHKMQVSYKIRFRQFVSEIAKKYELPNNKKRTYIESFGECKYDIERYGQEIDDRFFRQNIGHGVIG